MRKNKIIRVIIAIAAALTACTGALVLFLKKKKRFYSTFTIAAVILCGVMMGGMTAYAADLTGTEQDAVTTETDTTEPEYDYNSEPDEIITGEETEIAIGDFLDPNREPNQFTPPGNLTLVDDFNNAQAEEKQFITVTTKNGNTFYIIIDRAGKTENVYFLNLVDEYDLLQILQGEDAQMPELPPGMATPTPTGEQPGQSEQPDETTPKPKNTNTAGLLIMLVVIAAVGGAFYYFKVFKPKQGATPKTATPGLDEFEFDPDEDDLFSDSADIREPDGGDYKGDNDTDEDIPDFTAQDNNDFTIDFDAETPESEDNE